MAFAQLSQPLAVCLVYICSCHVTLCTYVCQVTSHHNPSLALTTPVSFVFTPTVLRTPPHPHPQIFSLNPDVKSIYETQACESNSRSKDNHLVYHVGETIYLLLLQHEKLPPHCFLAEKEDGTGRPGGVEWGCCVQVHLSVLLSRALPFSSLCNWL